MRVNVFGNATLQRGNHTISWPDLQDAERISERATSKYILRWGRPEPAAGSTAAPLTEGQGEGGGNEEIRAWPKTTAHAGQTG